MTKRAYGGLSQEDAFFMNEIAGKGSSRIEWDGGTTTKGTNTKSSNSTVYAPPCYESHPPLKFKKDGVEYKIYGGSCSYPVVTDADIYVGLSHDMCSMKHKFPWDDEQDPVVEFLYSITDMAAPKNPVVFHKMVDWLCNQLQLGKKVHVGCMGGHGRTGILLSAIVAQMSGEKDAIQYVRKNYCHKAVESSSQIQFLMKEFGVSKAEASKKYDLLGSSTGWGGSKGTTKNLPVPRTSNGWDKKLKEMASKKSGAATFVNSVRTYSPVPNATNMWSTLDK